MLIFRSFILVEFPLLNRFNKIEVLKLKESSLSLILKSKLRNRQIIKSSQVSISNGLTKINLQKKILETVPLILLTTICFCDHFTV
jgi:hypothetical protein